MTGQPIERLELQDVRRLRLAPGDVLVVRIPERITREQAERIKRTVQDALPAARPVLVFEGGATLDVAGGHCPGCGRDDDPDAAA